MIKILPPLQKYKDDTWRILPVKCYIDNSVHLLCGGQRDSSPLVLEVYVEIYLDGTFGISHPTSQQEE
jgi:hypothetical protein